MSIKHMVRQWDKQKNNTVLQEVTLRPMKAIRLFCFECMGFVKTEVDGCTDPHCPLFPFRTGKAHTGRKGNKMINRACFKRKD